MLSSMEATGLKELDKALAELGAAAGSNALVAALKDAAQPVHSDMIANAPEDSGTLKEGIKMRSRKGKGTGASATVTVGTKKSDFYGAISTEFGRDNLKPRPFIRLALEKNWQKSTSIFSYALKKRIQQQAKKLAKQKAKLG